MINKVDKQAKQSEKTAYDIQMGKLRRAHPQGLSQWYSSYLLPAIEKSDDFFAVFPPEFSSVKVLFDTGKKNNGIPSIVAKYLRQEIVDIFAEVLEKQKIKKLEAFFFFIKEEGTINNNKLETKLALNRVRCHILRIQKDEVYDDYDDCRKLGDWLYREHKILAREMRRHYFDLKFETVYNVYKSCVPWPVDAFYIFDNSNVWGAKRGWVLNVHNKHFKNIKIDWGKRS